MKSLRTQLWVWLAGLLTSIGLILAVGIYLAAQKEANEFFDIKLRQIAIVVGDVRHEPGSPVPSGSFHDAIEEVVVQVWDSAGVELRGSHPSVPIIRGTATGYRDITTEFGRRRRYTLVTPEYTIQVSQLAAEREELAMDAALQSLIPLAVVIPLSWLCIAIIIKRVFRELDRLSRLIARRNPVDTQPIERANLPGEVVPLVDAMNALIDRLQAVVALQKQFVADAAHELRTPLTALQLQVENLRKVVTTVDAAPRINELERGIQRASALTRQLLRMARHHGVEERTRFVTTDLVELAKESIAAVLPIADHLQHDLGLVQSDSIMIEGDPEALRVLVGNILENALRYTPNGGVIDVAIRGCGQDAVLEIRDTGPGLAQDQLECVLQPFHRVAGATIEGSGLGLSIAARIVAQHAARITLTNRDDRSGLLVRVVFPRHRIVTDR